MKTRQYSRALAAFGFAALLGLTVDAQTATPPGASAPKPASSDLTEAEVRKVDRENRKITLKHAEIKSLDMPPMTMVFQVEDASLLDRLKAGDKVRFKASNEAGKFTVTEIQPAR